MIPQNSPQQHGEKEGATEHGTQHERLRKRLRLDSATAEEEWRNLKGHSDQQDPMGSYNPWQNVQVVCNVYIYYGLDGQQLYVRHCRWYISKADPHTTHGTGSSEFYTYTEQ